jgi:hypothetical protein
MIITVWSIPDKRVCPRIHPRIRRHGLVDGDTRVKRGLERPELHRADERRAGARVHQAHGHPASPRDEDRLGRPVDRRSLERDPIPEVGAQVQVELRRRAVAAVVVPMQELHADQVFATDLRRERVAVPQAGREAPQRLQGEVVKSVAHLVGGDLVVLAAVDVRTVGEVGDVCVGVPAAAKLVVQPAVDAQKT